MENKTAKKIIRYTLTPQIIPRISDLFFSGFSNIAFFMAQIYNAARLLPFDHPYLNSENIGRFGVRHVIAEAGNNLVFSRKNIDQIIIYIMMLAGIVLLLTQVLMLGLGIFVQTSYAAPAMPSTFAAYFLTPDATHDIAFVLLDRVFGIPDFFLDAGKGGTCVVQGIECFNLGQSTRKLTPDNTIYTTLSASGGSLVPGNPITVSFPWPFHLALHKMFEIYSFGLLLIAAFIFIYFVAAIVAETAQSGTPFGKRFNHVWAPLRLVAAIGLLVPLSSGLNSGQYILMFAAKFGSGFATNGWVMFNETAVIGGNTLLGSTDTLVSTPKAPPVNTFLEFMSVVSTCVYSYDRMYHNRKDRDVVKINAWLINPAIISLDPRATSNTNFKQALEYFNNSDIIIRFGELRDEEHQTRDGRVVPYCGEVSLQITDIDEIGSPGSYEILDQYYNLIDNMWSDIVSPVEGIKSIGEGCDYQSDDYIMGCIGYNVSARYLSIGSDPNAPLPNSKQLKELREFYQDDVQDGINSGVKKQRDSPEWFEQLTQLGWGGASIWYNKVAQLNGSLIGAAYSLPTIKKYPLVMENVRRKKAAADTDTLGKSRHQIYQGPDSPILLSDEEEKQIGNAMYQTQTIWRDHYAEKQQSGNSFVDIVNMIFGTAGLFNIHENADAGIHPLAQLAAIGRTIIDTAIRNLGYSAAAGLGGGIINLFEDHIGSMSMTISGFLSQIAMTGITLGFVLFYIIPLLPFIYFFFAVGGWIKGIFEAMVGVPLWALAHLRIDGNGLPGDVAMGGYYLILEIFLRPILIIFGFVASITIFAAQVQVLHEIWPLIVSNVGGYDVDSSKSLNVNQTGGATSLRGAIDKFFFTVIYAIIVYMLAMSSFKMIDLIPNQILRWMGTSVSTFGDESGDPAENLVRNSFMGANMVGGPMKQAMGGLRGAASEGGEAVSGLMSRSS